MRVSVFCCLRCGILFTSMLHPTEPVRCALCGDLAVFHREEELANLGATVPLDTEIERLREKR
jgi:hypothetical protein